MRGVMDHSRRNRLMSQFRSWSWWGMDVLCLDRNVVPGRDWGLGYLLDVCSSLLSREATLTTTSLPPLLLLLSSVVEGSRWV